MSGKKISWLPEWAQKIAGLASGSNEPAVIAPQDLLEAASLSGALGIPLCGTPYLLHRCPVCKGAMRLDGVKDFGSGLEGREVWAEEWRCGGCGKRLNEVQLLAAEVKA